MLSRGYLPRGAVDGVTYKVPFGSLRKPNSCVETGIDHVRAAADGLGLKLEGAMAVKCEPWVPRDAPAADEVRSDIDRGVDA